jgi:hypothetical protein
VPHKLAYVAWMTIETVFALSAVAGIVWLLVTPSQATKSVSWREIPISQVIDFGDSRQWLLSWLTNPQPRQAFCSPPAILANAALSLWLSEDLRESGRGKFVHETVAAFGVLP